MAPSTLSSARMDCCVSVHDEGRSVGWKGKGIDEQLFYLKVTEKLRNLKNGQKENMDLQKIIFVQA